MLAVKPAKAAGVNAEIAAGLKVATSADSSAAINLAFNPLACAAVINAV